MGRIFTAQRFDLQLEGLRSLGMFAAIASGNWFTLVNANFRILALVILLIPLALLAAIYLQRQAGRKATMQGIAG